MFKSQSVSQIPFNLPYITNQELIYLQEALTSNHLEGGGNFTKKCQTWLEKTIGCDKVLLTHSCTAALEMSAILADIQPGDEVIMPSYTFVSTANAFVLRGAIPVFVDIHPSTLNLDEQKIEAAITSKSRAIVPVHYGGVSCEMQSIMTIAENHGLAVIEDAAQGILSTYKEKPLGSMGHLATMSFHNTKNVVSGEGGALLINNPIWRERAEVIWEKGTNRQKFVQGQVDKYTWIDIGSSYLPSELTAAFLYAQLEKATTITNKRLKRWNKYHEAFLDLEKKNLVRRPVIPEYCQHNGHLYYLILPDINCRNQLIQLLKDNQINAVFHYIPLHSSPAGQKFGRSLGTLKVTDELSSRLLRLPLYATLGTSEIEKIIEIILVFFRSL